MALTVMPRFPMLAPGCGLRVRVKGRKAARVVLLRASPRQSDTSGNARPSEWMVARAQARMD
jgi:thioesterase domain-containing protein